MIAQSTTIMRPTLRPFGIVSGAVGGLAAGVLWSSSLVTAAELGAEPEAAAQADAPSEVLFALEVHPLLARKCFSCHGEGDKLKGDLDLRTLEATLAGGESSDQVLVPGDAEASLLFTALTWEDPDYQMPPKESERLGADDIDKVRRWIDGGAPWPDADRLAALRDAHAEGVVVATSGGLSDDWTHRRYQADDLWAYRPVRRPEIPPEHQGNPVDHFIERGLAAVGIAPAPPTDAPTFIRRATFDLTGLPPDPDAVDAFVAEWAQDPDAAVASLVERLLASPRYGEQMGRHWLDVVRYADTAGLANDFERPNAWRYRDYVIRAFNQDKPFDRFIREQIAGDEIDPDSSESLIATGFLRMGAWEQTSMEVSKLTRQMWLDDVTDSVGQTFLAHALQCARCHDHKFDPVPTRDYYAMQAVFAATQFAERDAPWLDEENLAGMAEDEDYLRLRRKRNAAELAELEAREKELGELQTPEDLGRERIARKNRTRFNWELDRYQPIALSVYNGKSLFPANVNGRLKVPEDPMAEGELEQTAILMGGDPFTPGDPVAPGVLSAVDRPGAAIPRSPSGRRTALAEWIASPDNPLTARVIVNRIWGWHFHQAIAANANNFGATGAKPSHPELLDFLASEFIARGWSVKELHRLIMTSAAYRRSTAHPDPQDLAERDPDGRTIAVFMPRRLAAEEIRDAMLAVSGELNPQAGGIPARPDINLEAALQPRMIMGTFAPSYQPHPKPGQRNRRSVYTHRIRGLRDPFMEVFDQPSPEKSCERRDASTVAPQAFTLMNSEESADRALAFAQRLVEAGGSDGETIARAFRLAFGRPPSGDEASAAVAHWIAMRDRHAAAEPVRREFPTRIERHAQEENTGQPFQFTEVLEVYEDYVPDVQPHEVDANVRALADVCLVLFNTNEFLHVY